MQTLTAKTALIILIQGTFFSLAVKYSISNISEELQEDEEATDFECPSNGNFPHPICSMYYECRGGNTIPTVKDCLTSTNRLFSIEDSMCDYAIYVHCGDRFRPTDVPSTIYTPPTTKPITSTTPPPFTNCTVLGTTPHPMFCEWYYNCSEGISSLLRCPNGTLFDAQPEYSECAPPEDVDCGHRVRPNPTEDFVCPEDEDGGRFPDPGNCAAFYTCSNGRPIPQLCPLGLVFNKYLQVCDHVENVDCTDRVLEI